VPHVDTQLPANAVHALRRSTLGHADSETRKPFRVELFRFGTDVRHLTRIKTRIKSFER